MGQHISDTLYSLCYVMTSDEDQPVIMDICVGFNIKDELVVCVDFHDYDDPARRCSTAAVVHYDDSRAMARRHHLDHDDLPLFISQCMERWARIVNASLSQVVACFKEITECLLDEGCRFTIIRTYAPHRRACC